MKGFIVALFLVLVWPAFAIGPDEMLEDPALEARAREIGKELRCLVCQNQSIDDSDAELARDLRVLIRERLKRGDTNAEAIAFVVARYGDYVLLRPPVKPSTYLLWLGPLLILLAGGFGLGLYLRRRKQAALEVQALSPEEERRIQNILDRHR
ncbi:MAG: cytochrome c-type biogenesis protein [Pseudomonadota bacterium]